jgi:hypothetical protein
VITICKECKNRIQDRSFGLGVVFDVCQKFPIPLKLNFVTGERYRAEVTAYGKCKDINKGDCHLFKSKPPDPQDPHWYDYWG